MKRNLDGVYFRVKNEEGQWDNVCFSDLSDEQKMEMLKDRSEDWLKSMCMILANTIKKIGDQFDIECRHDYEEEEEET